MYKVECPYCEEYVEIEFDGADVNGFDYECPNCEKEFEVEIEYEPNLIASEIVYKECEKCGRKIRKYYIRNCVFPYPKNEKCNVLCETCYYEEVYKDIEEEKEHESEKI